MKKVVVLHWPLWVTILTGVVMWFCPHPEALSDQAWHLLSIFTATIVGVITRPLPMGAVAIASMAIVTLTGTLTMEQALEGYGKSAIWLIVFAFFISHGFIKTKLGTRIAYYFVRIFGKTSLGLGYSLVLSETILAPAIPSITARSGGIIYPIANALSLALGSKPTDSSRDKLGSFLILVAFQASIITSAMFLTAMAANPVVKELAKVQGVDITWSLWALAASVPGLVSLIVVPYFIYLICPPQLKKLPDAPRMAAEKLKEMGKMTRNELIMLGVFILLLVLWIAGEKFGIDPLTTALLGVSILIVTRVITFNELLEVHSAWDTLIWFGALFTLAKYLNQLGVIKYFSENMAIAATGLEWHEALLVLGLVYFYSHYGFASCMAHVGAMFAAFMSVAVILGAPALLTALIFAFISNLFGGITHYGIGNAPVLYGAGYTSIQKWWVVGLLVSIVNIAIWLVVGGMWWKYLGYWG